MINFKWVFFGLGAVCCIAGIIVEAISRSKPKHENLLDRERIAYRDRARRNPPAVVNY